MNDSPFCPPDYDDARLETYITSTTGPAGRPPELAILLCRTKVHARTLRCQAKLRHRQKHLDRHVRHG